MDIVTLATVTEAEADADTAAIFADIRETMGVALVNLIWRHLAITPAALSWSWQCLKPIYENGSVPRAAWALRQSLELPELSNFNERDRLAMGREAGDLQLIDAVLRTYERGNAQNLVALCALRLTLNPAMDNPSSIAEHSHALPAAAHNAQAEKADRVSEALPPLPAMADLNPAIRADIESLSEVWVAAQHRGMVPSVFRHLAHWPALLSCYSDKLHSVVGGADSVAKLANKAVDDAVGLAVPLIDALATNASAPLDEKTHEWLAKALDLFIDGMIGRGVVIVPAMRNILPQPAPTTPER